EYYLTQLQKLSVEDVKLEPFRYQLSPSLPVKKDGPGKALIVLLAGILGGVFACGRVLLREVMLSGSRLSERIRGVRLEME
ncbi:LPS O-antigen length regulator, partial [Escherichia coli]|nr:LPS O-antigen length regulator [Escherichia coli]